MLWRRRGNRDANFPTPATPAEIQHELDLGPAEAADSAQPSFLAPVALRASLGPDTAVTGRLSFNQPTRLDGTLRGEVHATDLLVIGDTGFVDGTVRATTVVVLGTVQGDVFASERIEIGPKGSLKGSLETRELVVREGAKLDGECRINPVRGATVHVLRPRVAAEALSDADADASVVSGQSD